MVILTWFTPMLPLKEAESQQLSRSYLLLRFKSPTYYLAVGLRKKNGCRKEAISPKGSS